MEINMNFKNDDIKKKVYNIKKDLADHSSNTLGLSDDEIKDLLV